MATDLTDVELAALLGVHKRTVQRRCHAGKLPGAYRVGRFWRIPRRAVRGARLHQALLEDDVEKELRSATLLCEELDAELTRLANLRLGSLQDGPPPPTRDWRRLADEVSRLESAANRLSSKAAGAARRFASG